jgi:hypothetical protein
MINENIGNISAEIRKERPGVIAVTGRVHQVPHLVAGHRIFQNLE